MEERNTGPRDQGRESSQSIIFTYYNGDINTVVDEHFFRALNKTSMPKDLSTKTRELQRPSKSDVATPASWSPSWSKSLPSSSASVLGQGSSNEEAVQNQGVIMGPATLPTGHWAYSTRQGSSYDVPPLLYRQPGIPQNSPSSFLHLLHTDRSTGGAMVAHSSKPDLEPEWGSGSAYTDTGVQMPEKSKDLYWY
ncbi:uncharacterized protein LOC143524896 isoform X2 [Brachyhypopomus gauderio]|uniref:uncharacterized protein LOC143524896 isoform X2 n=1 Tax=Brachyhypopomus gauderio TaxID=698409 RepID=UPI004041E0AC